MCHFFNMCIMSSIVEITVIFLAWHLNVWVHGQICCPSKLIEIVCMCKEMICAKWNPAYTGISCRRACTHSSAPHTHLTIAVLQIWGVWNFIVSQWQVCTSDTRWGLEHVELSGQPIGQRWGWGDPCFLYERQATFLSCLFILSLLKTDRKSLLVLFHPSSQSVLVMKQSTLYREWESFESQLFWCNLR